MPTKRMHALTHEYRSTVSTAIATAFGFVIALTWNDFIRISVNDFLASIGATGEGFTIRLAAALFITLIAMTGIILISRWKK